MKNSQLNEKYLSSGISENNKLPLRALKKPGLEVSQGFVFQKYFEKLLKDKEKLLVKCNKTQ